MVNEDWEEIVDDLERQELQAQGGVATPQLYGKLLAIYLFQNDLCNAKFLWKRIPDTIKSQNPELASIWSVGVAMWKRDTTVIYRSLNSGQWSENVSNIMKSLKDRIQERNMRLIGRAYSSIHCNTMGVLLGVTPSEAITAAKERDWIVEGQMIKPKSVTNPIPPITSTEHQLHKLTSFVSFLEN